jgi:CRISPR-associated protein (TIGR02584 family)
MPEPSRNILLCVAGGTPAIITETLWALKEGGDHVDEVRVITTLEGRDKILSGKVGTEPHADQSLLDEDHGQFFKFLRDYPEVGKIKFDENCLYILTTKPTGVPSPRDDDKNRLSDILTDEDNEKAANQICEIVRELTSSENIHIHASIAGGRKTMSLYLMAAMQLFGRHDDKMSHVLVSKEVEFGAPKFFYKTPTPEPILDPTGKSKRKANGDVLTTDDINIYLADIQFIRLRGTGSEMLNRTVESYDRIVDKAQENLERFNLVFDLNASQVTVGKRNIKLTDRDFFVYVMFAYLRCKDRGNEGSVQLEEISIADFDAVCRLISRSRGKELGYQYFSVLRADSLQNLNYWFFKETNPNRSDEFALSTVKLTMSDAVSTIKSTLKRGGASEEFAVVNKNKYRKKVEPIYGLRIEPDRIKFS